MRPVRSCPSTSPRRITMNTALTHLPFPQADTQELQRLLAQAHEGDLAVLPELRAALDRQPELWKQVGDLAAHAELTMLRLAAGQDLFALEAMKRRLAVLKAELAGPSPSALEKLLVDRVGVCWLQVHYLDMQASTGPAGTSTPQGVWAQRRLDSAQRRYLFSIKQLATVRKLLRPALAPLEVAARLHGSRRVVAPKRRTGKSGLPRASNGLN